MNAGPTYTLARGGERYGPYTLEQLRDYVSQGSVQMTDLVWSPGMATWSPVSTVLGSTADRGATASAMVPPPIPASPYAPPQARVADPVFTTGFPKPLSMHWALVLVLSIVTCGVFALVWMFLQAAWVRRLDPTNNALIILAVGIPAQFLLSIAAAVEGEGSSLGLFAYLVGFVATEVAYFSMREVMQNRFVLRLSGILTFFFTLLYLQYHMSRIANGEVPPRS
jgi:hypothetical protein